MLFNLLLASITSLLCFFLLLLTVARENTRLKLALAIPAGIPVTLTKILTDTSPLVADKTIRALSK